GNHRNVDRKEAAKRKGRNFLEDNICKHYLLGFCPQHEDLFHSTKRDIGKCQKVHSEAMKTEFENHPDHKKYRAQYEERLRHYLDELVRSAEEWASKERRNIKAENLAIEAAGPTELAKAEIKAMKDAAQTLLEDAEKLAESSRLEEAKKKTDEAKDFQQKAQEYEENAVKLRTEDVCDVCGSRMESGDPQFAKFRHIDGKIHVGFLKIREFLDGLKKRRGGRRAARRTWDPGAEAAATGGGAAATGGGALRVLAPEKATEIEEAIRRGKDTRKIATAALTAKETEEVTRRERDTGETAPSTCTATETEQATGRGTCYGKTPTSAFWATTGTEEATRRRKDCGKTATAARIAKETEKATRTGKDAGETATSAQPAKQTEEATRRENDFGGTAKS
ncbi:unnamed protein product, partial [Prorocentrum cordatum]